MRFTRTLYAALLLTAALASQAWAQAYPGEEDVTVNSGAIGRGYLLYPGDKYGRTVRPLLQPGEKPDAVIHLHMPTHHHHRVTTSEAANPQPVAPAPRVARTRAKPEPPVSTNTAALPEDSAARLVGAGPVAAAPAKPPVKPMRTATTAPPPAANTGATTVPFSFSGSPVAPSAPPTRTASATPPARTTPSAATAAGLKRQTTIPFATGVTSLAPVDVNAIHGLATALNAAVASANTRVQLVAFGGPRGDKSSDSRRLSLKRALVVRELLIEDGVPSEKIDVRAMGGADDSGAADRVDVFVRG